MTHTPHQTTTAAPTGTAGERRALAHYPTAHGERTIYAQRVHGRVRVTDRPTTSGRSYLITRHVACLAELNALLADYLDQAHRHGDCPMRVHW